MSSKQRRDGSASNKTRAEGGIKSSGAKTRTGVLDRHPGSDFRLIESLGAQKNPHFWRERKYESRPVHQAEKWSSPVTDHSGFSLAHSGAPARRNPDHHRCRVARAIVDTSGDQSRPQRKPFQRRPGARWHWQTALQPLTQNTPPPPQPDLDVDLDHPSVSFSTADS